MSRIQTKNVSSGRVSDLSRDLIQTGQAEALPPWPGLQAQVQLPSDNWGVAAENAVRSGLRWAAVWGDHRPPSIQIFALLFGCDGHLLLQTHVSDQQPELPSQTPAYPAANRPERHLSDMLGLRWRGHPDARRWTRHQAWPADVWPLRREFDCQTLPPGPTPGDCDYPFVPVAGAGVYEIPVGPVHAGIIEPGHFRFQALGEEILRLEEHLGYVHRGVEKIAVGRDAAGLLRLAARVSGDSSIAHSWAAAQALERALAVEVPRRALHWRAILAERERIANHLGDIGAICNDVGFAFAQVQLSRQRELWQRRNFAAFGHRLLMDTLVPGGVAREPDAELIAALRRDGDALRTEVADLLPLLLEYPSLQDRLRDTGILRPDQARRYGVVGYVGRASNLQDDLRRDAPYAPYENLTIEVPAYAEGDVAKRVRVRGEEILVSLTLIDQLLERLPQGPLATPCNTRGRAVEGLGLVEGWSGETLAYVRLDATGRVERYFPRDPSWLSWPALEILLDGVIVPDFPVCNKSVNASYAGQDL